MARYNDCLHFVVCDRCPNCNPTECEFFLPEADVVEVRHGEWDNNGEFYQCSDCSNFTSYNYDYCPYCGAKMDGGKTE